MSTHLSYEDNAFEVYCPETEQNESRHFAGGDTGPQEYYCGGCRDFLDETLPLAHHVWTEETWNCEGNAAEMADDGETCLGCGYNAEHTLETVAELLMDIERAEMTAYFTHGRHR